MSASVSFRRLRSLIFAIAALVMSAWIGGARPQAHELGLTRAAVTFAADRTYTVDVLVDPESLLAKLEILSGRSPSAGVPVDELPARIEALGGILRERVGIMFDGVRQQTDVTYTPGP